MQMLNWSKVLLLLAIIASAMVFSAAPAESRRFGCYYSYRPYGYRYNPGYAVAAAVTGAEFGLIAASTLAGRYAYPGYYPYPVYYSGNRAYRYPQYIYYPYPVYAPPLPTPAQAPVRVDSYAGPYGPVVY